MLVIAFAAVMLIGAILFFFVFNGGELIGNIFSGNRTNENGDVRSEEESRTTSTDRGQNDDANTEQDVTYVTVPDMVGLHQDELENRFTELNLIPDFIYVEDDAEEGTVIWVAGIGEEVPVRTKLLVQISQGPSHIFIENPRIVITTRYDSGRGRFSGRDSYVDSVTAAGGIPIMPANDSMLADALRYGNTHNVDAIAEMYDGLILTGGGDISARFFGQDRHPASADPDENCDIAEIALCIAFINAGKPVLGVNRGMQVINVAMGGDLYQDIPDLLGIASEVHSGNNRHTIQIEPNTWLYELYGSSLQTYSSHHQALKHLAEGLTVVARYGEVIEAVEYGNVLGVQFNPERLADGGTGIYSDFIRRCSIVPTR